MKRLFHYFLYRPAWQKLPMLPRMYSSEYSLKDVDRDTETLMKLTHTRCPQGVEILKRRHRLQTSRQLIEQLPARRHKRRVMGRVLSLIQRWFGLTTYDPMKSLARGHQRINTQDGRR